MSLEKANYRQEHVINAIDSFVTRFHSEGTKPALACAGIVHETGFKSLLREAPAMLIHLMDKGEHTIEEIASAYADTAAIFSQVVMIGGSAHKLLGMHTITYDVDLIYVGEGEGLGADLQHLLRREGYTLMYEYRKNTYLRNAKSKISIDLSRVEYERLIMLNRKEALENALELDINGKRVLVANPRALILFDLQKLMEPDRQIYKMAKAKSWERVAWLIRNYYDGKLDEKDNHFIINHLTPLLRNKASEILSIISGSAQI